MVEGSSRPYVNEVDRLVAQAAAGDARAFEALYRLHSGRVYALCLRLSGDREQAEELAQLAFVRAWRKLHTFRGESAFATWMHRLTVNVALETLRADRRRADRVVSLDDVGVFSRAGQRETPGDKVDLEAAIARLPERARLVFVLFQIEGYQHEEIANLTGMAVGSSKAQLHRARQLLREMLAP